MIIILILQMRKYVRYLLLSNKLSQRLGAQNNNKYLLSHTVSVAWEFGSGLAAWLWNRLSDEVAVKVSARTVIWRLDWARGLTSTMAPSHGWQVDAELLAGRLSSSPPEFVHRVLWVSSHPTEGFHGVNDPTERQKLWCVFPQLFYCDKTHII